MIARITLENFFSFGEATDIYLNPGANVLVGINGSGKSNLLKAIRLLYEGVEGVGFEQVFLKEWGGFGSVANFNQKEKDFIRLTFEFDCEVINAKMGKMWYKFEHNPTYEMKVHRSGATGYFLEEQVELKELGVAPFLYRNNTGGQMWVLKKESFDIDPIWPLFSGLKGTEPALQLDFNSKEDLPLGTLKKAIEIISVYDYFDTTLKSDIRQPANYDTEERLLPGGTNLVSLLNRMKNNDALAYEKIEEALQRVNPHFKDISFDLFGSKMLLLLREKHLQKSVSIEHISDGTLRYLLLLSILLNPKRGLIVCIDEPEIGLHPDMINFITESIRQAGQEGSQMIIATHSPLVLNAFELEEVLIFEKNEKNQTVVSTKSEEDFEDWEGDFLVGQMWLRGLIGGKRW